MANKRARDQTRHTRFCGARWANEKRARDQTTHKRRPQPKLTQRPPVRIVQHKHARDAAVVRLHVASPRSEECFACLQSECSLFIRFYRYYIHFLQKNTKNRGSSFEVLNLRRFHIWLILRPVVGDRTIVGSPATGGYRLHPQMRPSSSSPPPGNSHGCSSFPLTKNSILNFG